MRTKVIYILLLVLLTPILVSAKRKGRHQNSISAALQTEMSSFGSTPVVQEPMLLASTERFSERFDVDPVHKQIKAEPARGSLPETKQEVKEEQKTNELSKESQQKAQAALQQVENKGEEPEKIELQFEDADLQTFVQQISEIFDVTFISDESIDPLPKTESPTKALKGNKISFKTNKPLSREQAWNLFITFMDIAGFAIVQQPDKDLYRIQTIEASRKAPLPTFIGIDSELLPDNDDMVRYLYFVENASLQALEGVINALVSKNASKPILLAEQKGILLTDKSYNIKSLMKIVRELDKVTMPQAMSVLKLHQADAIEVKKLYDELTQTNEDKSPFRPFGAKKQPTAIYFPESARIIAEPRTNSLILLGPQDAIKKIEDFVIKFVDVELDQPYSPLYTYHLQYATAHTVAEIMNASTKFGQGSEAAKAGGVRGRDKYLKEMLFIPEPTTNKLIIKGDYEDYLMAREVIRALDEPQPQVAIEVLILSVDLLDTKQMGSVLRSKMDTATIPALKNLLGKNVVFQTSGLNASVNGAQGIVTNENGPGFQRLLGNLLSLVTNAPPGNTIVTFGQDLFGVWGLFQVLQTITNTQVVSNPFLVTSNQTPAQVQIGTTRRIAAQNVYTQTIQSSAPTTQGITDDSAALTVKIRPQINSDGMIVMNLTVDLQDFTDPNNQSSGNKTKRTLTTQAVLADNEVLALGGLIRNSVQEGSTKVPILGDIPVLGWLFKNRGKVNEKTSLLILISAKIISPKSLNDIHDFTKKYVQKYHGSLELLDPSEKRDPIHKLFFAESEKHGQSASSLIFERSDKAQREKKKKKKKNANNKEELTKVEPAPAPVQAKPVTVIASPGMINAAPLDKAPPSPTSVRGGRKRNRSLSTYLQEDEEEVRV